MINQLSDNPTCQCQLLLGWHHRKVNDGREKERKNNKKRELRVNLKKNINNVGLKV